MDTRFLESFIAVAELGSMAEAARRLAVTPAAVAQRVRALEAEIGARLLVRVGRTVRPTEAGAGLLSKGRVVLRDVADLKAATAGGGLAGELRIGSISTALTGTLPAVLKRLLDAAPKLELFVEPGTSASLYRKATEGDLDAAILVKPAFALPKTCDWLPIRSERLVVLAPRAAAARDPLELLRDEPFIRYDRNHWGGRLADAYLRKLGIAPRERLELDSLEAIAVMVHEEIGVSLVPDWPAPWPEEPSVVRLSLPGEVPVRRIGMLSLRASPRRRMIEALKRALSDERGAGG